MEITMKQSIEGETFQGVAMHHGELTDREFCGCSFKGCDFTGTNFSDSRFEDCDFEDCNLSLAVFAGARLQGVRFTRCKLEGVALGKCDGFALTIRFEASLIRSCSFAKMNLKQTQFRNCEIADSDFVSAQLTEADFSGTALPGTLFENCDLTKADFSDAREYRINPQLNKLKKARFSLPDAVGLLAYLDIRID